MARDNALDFVKGAAVVAMTAHHSINYFPAPYLSTKYVHFVSGAFPFLAGFMVSYILSRRNETPERKHALGRRLIFRGGRLLLLCGALNLLLASLLGNSAKFGRLTLDGYSQYLLTLYWSGNYRQVSFSLLVPIGYVLISMGILEMLQLLRPIILGGLALLLFAFCTVADYYPSIFIYYADYFAVGILGAALGSIPAGALGRFCQAKLLVTGIYLTSLAAIVFFGQPFPLFALSVTATLLLFYMVGKSVDTEAAYIRPILTLGQYSLFMYIAQIVILFVFRLCLFYFLPELSSAFVAFIVVCVAQLAICLAFNRLRARSPVVDRIYSAIFA